MLLSLIVIVAGVQPAVAATLQLLVRPAEHASPPGVLHVAMTHGDQVLVTREVAVGETRDEIPDGWPERLTVALVEPGWWAAPVDVDLSASSDTTASLELWPTGSLVVPATLQPRHAGEENRELPDARVIFCGCAGPDGRATDPCGEAAVQIDHDASAYAVEVPAGCRDLELVTREYSTVSLDRVEIAATKVGRVARVYLSQGGSIAGRVVDASSGLPLVGVRVEAGPQFVSCTVREEIGALGTGEALEVEVQTARAATTSYRGRFRLSGLEAGDYRLELAKDGYATRTLWRVPATPDSEYDLEDVELGPGAVVEVYALSDPCEGEPLNVSLLSNDRSGSSTAVASGAFEPPIGRATLTGVPPGSYLVAVTGRCGALGVWPLAMPELEVDAGEHALVQVDLDLPRLEGEVLLDGEPVSAEVTLEPATAAAGAIRFSSTSEGGFAVTVPGAGGYRATVAWDGGESAVDIEVTDDDDRTEIVIPAGILEGVVVDRRGDPVAGAEVLVSEAVQSTTLRRPKTAASRSDDDGGFRVTRLAPGEWVAMARLEERASEASAVEITRSTGKAGPITLVLDEPEALEIRVVDTAGNPIPGADVVAGWRSPSAPPGSAEGSTRDTTDEEGTVLLSAPRGIGQLRLMTTAPGRPVALGSYASRSPVVVTLPGQGGYLQVERRSGSWGVPGLPTAVLNANGALAEIREPMWTLSRGRVEPLGDGKLLTIGPLAPGSYGVAFILGPKDVDEMWRLHAQMSVDQLVTVHPGQTATVAAPF